MAVSAGAMADNIIRFSAPIAESPLPNKWQPAAPIVGDWVTTSATGCVDSPDRTALYPTTKVQYQSCNAVTRTRTVQPQEFNPRKNQYRNAGLLTSETQNTSTLNQPRSVDCRYNTAGTAPASAWHLYGAGTTLPQYLQFAGQSLPGTLTQYQVISGGVTYLRGAAQGAKGGGSDAYEYFTVCKVLPDQP
jgi:hypothetical protein